MSFSKVYACLVQKAGRKGRTKGEVDRIITWLTGCPTVGVVGDVAYGAFIDGAPAWNPSADFITGKVCGIQVETIADPRMKKLRQLDKLTKGYHSPYNENSLPERYRRSGAPLIINRS